MLGSASGSHANYPGHPPAAPGGLLSLVPDLVLGPRKVLDIGELQQPGPWSKRYDPLLRHGVEGADGLGSLGYQTGTSEPQPDEHGRATCAWRDKDPSHAKSRDVKGLYTTVPLSLAGSFGCWGVPWELEVLET